MLLIHTDKGYNIDFLLSVLGRYLCYIVRLPSGLFVGATAGTHPAVLVALNTL